MPAALGVPKQSPIQVISRLKGTKLQSSDDLAAGLGYKLSISWTPNDSINEDKQLGCNKFLLYCAIRFFKDKEIPFVNFVKLAHRGR